MAEVSAQWIGGERFVGIDRAVQQAIKLSEEKYCSVSATVGGVAAITHSYQILEDGRV